jgi:uncharacterized protein (DUF58 family)
VSNGAASQELDRQIAIYPTRSAIVLMAAGAPLSLALGTMAPNLWLIGVGWIILVAVLMLLDTRAGASASSLALDLSAPASLSVSGSAEAVLTATFGSGQPDRIECALESSDKLAVSPICSAAAVAGGLAEARFSLAPVRRGETPISMVWARWRGPLGLIWKQLSQNPGRTIVITPDIQGVKQEAVRLFSRDALHGLKTQLDAGEGAEFHALRDFQAGMDTRTIDWKQSARHGQLLAKEYRAERNNPIVLAIDSGRGMCEPIGGLARIDWALNAALLLAYVSLKLGDRAGLYSFDARPRGLSGPVGGVRAFSALQRAAGQIDYSSEETNYTLGLSSLADQLDRRSLVVVFTEFTDQTSAELMIENVGRLLGRHLVVFVAMRDEELEDLARAEPLAPDDVTRAVIAQSLLRERDLVVARLRRLGVEIVDASAKSVGPELLDRYLEIKRRSRI